MHGDPFGDSTAGAHAVDQVARRAGQLGAVRAAAVRVVGVAAAATRQQAGLWYRRGPAACAAVQRGQKAAPMRQPAREERRGAAILDQRLLLGRGTQRGPGARRGRRRGRRLGLAPNRRCRGLEPERTGSPRRRSAPPAVAAVTARPATSAVGSSTASVLASLARCARRCSRARPAGGRGGGGGSGRRGSGGSGRGGGGGSGLAVHVAHCARDQTARKAAAQHAEQNLCLCDAARGGGRRRRCLSRVLRTSTPAAGDPPQAAVGLGRVELQVA